MAVNQFDAFWRQIMARKKGGEFFDEATRRLVGHKFTDMGTMRKGILEMCQEMSLGGELKKRPVSREGFLEIQEV